MNLNSIIEYGRRNHQPRMNANEPSVAATASTSFGVRGLVRAFASRLVALECERGVRLFSHPAHGCSLPLGVGRLPARSARQAGSLSYFAFTLIELLTVMAIIGILASLLLTSLSKSKERARTAQCISNLRQVSLGMRMYADDGNGLYPMSGDEIPWDLIDNRTHRTGWMQQILDQVANKGVFHCPSDRRSLYSYFNGARAAYLGTNGPSPLDSKQIRFHSAYVLSGDSPWYEGTNTINDADKDDYTYNCVGGPSNGTPSRPWQMHNRGQNLLFEDGHAHWYRGYVANEMTFRYESIHGWK